MRRGVLSYEDLSNTSEHLTLCFSSAHQLSSKLILNENWQWQWGNTVIMACRCGVWCTCVGRAINKFEMVECTGHLWSSVESNMWPLLFSSLCYSVETFSSVVSVCVCHMVIHCKCCAHIHSHTHTHTDTNTVCASICFTYVRYTVLVLVHTYCMCTHTHTDVYRCVLRM